uniref:Putative ubiquitin-conjugating enzyme e2 r2-like protein n=1 Tax=Triatoma infestans TaxID=30076 RepID=A0A023F2W1_TRIIF
MAISSGAALKALQIEYKNLLSDPIEGFQVKLVYDDIFVWDVSIFGPPDTLYEGGYFKARMKFPLDYPYSPPTFRFITKMWHPNIFETGYVCISILHAPHSGAMRELQPSEKWNPTQNVRTILLSVLSLLNEPIINNPANVNAAEMYIRWTNSSGADKQYERIVREQVLESRQSAEIEGIIVPLTLEDYCMKTREKVLLDSSDELLGEYDFYDEDYDLYEESESSDDELNKNYTDTL